MICDELRLSNVTIHSENAQYILDNSFEMLRKAGFTFNTAIYANNRLAISGEWDFEAEGIHRSLMLRSKVIRHEDGELLFLAR